MGSTNRTLTDSSSSIRRSRNRFLLTFPRKPRNVPASEAGTFDSHWTTCGWLRLRSGWRRALSVPWCYPPTPLSKTAQTRTFMGLSSGARSLPWSSSPQDHVHCPMALPSHGLFVEPQIPSVGRLSSMLGTRHGILSSRCTVPTVRLSASPFAIGWRGERLPSRNGLWSRDGAARSDLDRFRRRTRTSPLRRLRGRQQRADYCEGWRCLTLRASMTLRCHCDHSRLFSALTLLGSRRSSRPSWRWPTH